MDSQAIPTTTTIRESQVDHKRFRFLRIKCFLKENSNKRQLTLATMFKIRFKSIKSSNLKDNFVLEVAISKVILTIAAIF
jgi:hypothetical protein